MKKKKVLLFGTFDVLHPGHEALFKQARRYGAKLTVILARDHTIKKIKKHEPVYGERARKRALEKSGLVDHVVLGSLQDKYRTIKKIKPDVICLGYDQTNFVGALGERIKSFKLKTRIVRLKPFKPNLYKSTILTRYVRHQIHKRERRGGETQ